MYKISNYTPEKDYLHVIKHSTLISVDMIIFDKK